MLKNINDMKITLVIAVGDKTLSLDLDDVVSRRRLFNMMTDRRKGTDRRAVDKARATALEQIKNIVEQVT